jgi:hypothetical protein
VQYDNTLIWDQYNQMRHGFDELIKMNKKLLEDRQRVHVAIKISAKQKDIEVGKLT